MFPAETVGIIGNRGEMARNIYEPLFTKAGYRVIGSDILDPTGMSNEEVVENADVVLFSILPLDSVARAMWALMPNAKPDTLWIHGSSVQQIRDHPIGDALLAQELRDRGVDTGFVHFMIAPTVKSLRGQAIVLGFPRNLANPAWESWIEDLLLSKKARVFHKTIEEHDELTKASQLLPMLMAIATVMVWQREGVNVSEMLRVAGAPAKLQALGALRSLSQIGVVSEIVTRHPAGPALVRRLAEVFTELADWVSNKEVGQITSAMRQARGRIDEDDLRKVLSMTDWFARLFGDLNGGAVGFSFAPEQNQVGLLAKVLSHLDAHKVDKTTTTAQRLPNGGAQFLIGVEPDLDDPSVRTAVREILDELGAELIEDDFTL